MKLLLWQRKEGQGDKMKRFTNEELDIAKSVDLVAVASSLGYTVRKIGRYYTLKEMDSIRIYNRTHWFRWSHQYDKGNNGGSQIDFLRVFAGMDFKSATAWLLDFAGYRRMENNTYEDKVSKDSIQKLKHQIEKQEKQDTPKKFILPNKSIDNSYLYSYLMEERGISKEIVDLFVVNNLIYESRHYHNIVFVGNDFEGKARFASMRGVFDKEGKAFKCDVRGNDKRYGFNVANCLCDEVVVFEAAIDLMSYMDIYQDYDLNMVALGMISDAPLETFLEENKQIKSIRFCLDNDEPGRNATKVLLEKYKKLGYEVIDSPPPKEYKDYNEWLVDTKKMDYERAEKQITKSR